MAIPNVLVIDDEPNFLVEALPVYGYEIFPAKDGLTALNILKEKGPDFFSLIILDLYMPKMNGWDFIKALKNNPDFALIPVIMLTGSEGIEKEVAGLKCGADDYLLKPVRLPNLLARIEALLRRTAIEKEKNCLKLDFPLSQNNPDSSISPLSDREKQILKLVTEGRNNNEIAQNLVIQEDTVKAHLKSIFRKLNVSNRMQAAMIAVKLCLL